MALFLETRSRKMVNKGAADYFLKELNPEKWLLKLEQLLHSVATETLVTNWQRSGIITRVSFTTKLNILLAQGKQGCNWGTTLYNSEVGVGHKGKELI